MISQDDTKSGFFSSNQTLGFIDYNQSWPEPDKDQPRPPARMPHRLYRVLGAGTGRGPNVVLMNVLLDLDVLLDRARHTRSARAAQAISAIEIGNHCMAERNQISSPYYIVYSHTDNHKEICSANNNGIIHNWDRLVAKTYSIHDKPPRSQILSFASKQEQKIKDN